MLVVVRALPSKANDLMLPLPIIERNGTLKETLHSMVRFGDDFGNHHHEYHSGHLASVICSNEAANF